MGIHEFILKCLQGRYAFIAQLCYKTNKLTDFLDSILVGNVRQTENKCAIVITVSVEGSTTMR